MIGGDKRTTAPDSASLDAPGGSQGHAQAPCPEGVGGRLEGSRSEQWGGGYQDICTVENFAAALAAREKNARDPRHDELARMGLQRHWLDVAAAIGVDAFLKMWRILDATPELQDESGSGLRMRMRRYESFLRYQRNRYIEGLHAAGMTSAQIRRLVAENIGEDLSQRHIDRLRESA